MRQSRTVKSANVEIGTGRATEDVEPNICVKRLSLYRHSARFDVDVAMNFEVPAVVAFTGLSERVEYVVSVKFAVR